MNDCVDTTRLEVSAALARMLAESNPSEAAKICRQVMQLYGNNPKVPMVQEAYRQLMSLGGIKDRPSK